MKKATFLKKVKVSGLTPCLWCLCREKGKLVQKEAAAAARPKGLLCGGFYLNRKEVSNGISRFNVLYSNR